MILFASFVVALALVAHDARRQRRRGVPTVFGLLPGQWFGGPIFILLAIGMAESALGTISSLTGVTTLLLPGMGATAFMVLVPAVYVVRRRMSPTPEEMRERRRAAARRQEIAYDEAYWENIAKYQNAQGPTDSTGAVTSASRTATSDGDLSPADAAGAGALPAPRR